MSVDHIRIQLEQIAHSAEKAGVADVVICLVLHSGTIVQGVPVSGVQFSRLFAAARGLTFDDAVELMSLAPQYREDDSLTYLHLTDVHVYAAGGRFAAEPISVGFDQVETFFIPTGGTEGKQEGDENAGE